MAEIKDILDKDKKGAENNAPAPQNEEIGKIKSTLEEKDKELKETKQKVSELEYQNRLSEVVQTYPYAAEYKDKIKEKVATGMSIEDATAIVLGKEKKYLTRDEIRAQENRGRGFGGSADTNLGQGSGSKEKTADELAKEVQELEARGEIKLS